MQNITFGTSGYRGIIGSSFTSDHAISICLAISSYLKNDCKCPSPRVIVGYDTRTGNSPQLEEPSYTYVVVKTLIDQGIQVDFCETFTPTPIISWATHTHAYDLGIILTASHNPPNYNGIKLSDSEGAPAGISITDRIEKMANQFYSNRPYSTKKSALTNVSTVNYNHDFLHHLKQLLKTTFDLPFPSFSSTYLIDTKCGSAIDFWKLATIDCTGTIIWNNDNHSSDFNFEMPDPTNKTTRDNFEKICKEKNCIGFSNDPDADRHMIIDENGQFTSPEKIAAIIAVYCINNGIKIHGIASTLANSSLIRNICTKANIQFHETKIGFKYFTSILRDAKNQNKLSLAVESSGGFSVSLHTLDKCGFLPILLILAIMKKQNKPLHELSAAIDQIYNKFYFVEDAISFSKQSAPSILEAAEVKTMFQTPIDSINHSDGLKITFSNSDWVLCRPSGTEPLIRVYAESKSLASANWYINQVKRQLAQ